MGIFVGCMIAGIATTYMILWDSDALLVRLVGWLMICVAWGAMTSVVLVELGVFILAWLKDWMWARFASL